MLINFLPISVVALSAALLPISASATISKNEIAKCAAIENAVNRLSCYDSLAKSEGLAKEVKTSSVTDSKWVIREKTDPLTDNSVYTAMILADSGKGRYGNHISLLIRCENNTTEMYINWASYLGRDDISVTYRIGKDKAVTSRWGLSTDSKATFFPGSPIPALKEIIESDTPSLVANLTPYNSNPITAVFNTSGAKEALSDIRESCGW